MGTYIHLCCVRDRKADSWNHNCEKMRRGKQRKMVRKGEYGGYLSVHDAPYYVPSDEYFTCKYADAPLLRRYDRGACSVFCVFGKDTA